ncbi:MULTISPECIES: EpsG family protein [unclassified Tatumella]|uniref:EpsG family protein n=1 Tax=unclassified Tatumella TaxID=2649542 RepID=UPI001BAF047E|nr:MULTISPECIES: EpsG family protein [unclassified Tatumella]MBS0857094.1 EpsG family protein [Tatumella sp. JGM16]MBS0913795.1 EpsG family protein [Tatumella sp. JGM91]
MIFIIISIVLSLFALIESKLLFYMSSIVVWLVFSLTYGYGYDWINYKNDYAHCLEANWRPFFAEPGLYLIMKVFAYLGASFSTFMFFVNSFIYYIVFYFCNKLKNPSLAFFTLFSFLGLFVFSEWIRQGVALCLVMLALMYLNSGKKGKYFSLIILAVTFHFTAILGIVSYFLSDSKENYKKTILVSSLITFVLLISLYNPYVLAWLPIFGEKISGYSDVLSESGETYIEYITSSRTIIFYFGVYFLFVMARKKYDTSYSSVISMYLVFLSRLGRPLVRIGYYFIPALVLYADECWAPYGKNTRTKFIKIIYILSILMISSIPVWNPLYWDGTYYHVTPFSSKNDVSFVIANKCRIINLYIDNHTIKQCK